MGICHSGSKRRENNKTKFTPIDEAPKSLVWPSKGPLLDEELKKMTLFPTTEQIRETEESQAKAKIDGSKPIFRVEELLEWPENDNFEQLETKYQEKTIEKLEFSQSLLDLTDYREDYLWAQ